jgi:hypothetical protein
MISTWGCKLAQGPAMYVRDDRTRRSCRPRPQRLVDSKPWGLSSRQVSTSHYGFRLYPHIFGANVSFLFLVMVSPGRTAKEWIVEILTTNHNGDNDAELERVQKEHPGEPDCVVDRRVLGALAPTRCESLI